MSTIPRASLLLALGAACLAPSVAHADELTTSPIHLHGADSGLVLE